MLVDYPFEWNKYMVPGKVRTFKKETPADVLEKAKKINNKMNETNKYSVWDMFKYLRLSS